jgi:beta-glucosidase
MRGRTYRYFEGEPLYPFGHGLSYTRFEYSNLKVDRARVAEGDTVRVSLNVKNVGARAGDEVVQLYARPVAPREQRALEELRGIERITLQPGETRQVSFSIVPSRDFTYYDADRKTYAVDSGNYEVQIGASSRDIRLKSTLTVAAKTVAAK